MPQVCKACACQGAICQALMHCAFPYPCIHTPLDSSTHYNSCFVPVLNSPALYQCRKDQVCCTLLCLSKCRFRCRFLDSLQLPHLLTFSCLAEMRSCVQVGSWLASWLWSSPAATDKTSALQARPTSKQNAVSEHQASATGTAAWDLIAAHAWELLHVASLR